MTRKHGIRAPRKPRGEDPAVTIPNQAKQITLLIDRCDFLQHTLDAKTMLADELSKSLAGTLDQLNLTAGCLGDTQQAYTRLQGWQDCAREMLGTRLDTTAPGA